MKRLDLQYMIFDVEQNIGGKTVKVKKQLPLEGLGMRVVRVGEGIGEVGPQVQVVGDYVGDMGMGRVRRRKGKHEKRRDHQIVLGQHKLKQLDQKAIAEVVKHLRGVDMSKTSIDKGKLDTENLSATAKRSLRKTLLDSSVLKIIDNGGYDDDELRPFLDFNYEMPKKVFKKVVKKCGFNSTQWAEIIGVNEERINSSRAFNHQQSMHVLKILLMFNHSYVVFNDKAYFKRWLKKINPDLGGTPPYFYLDSPSGIDVVRKRMHRIEHGIYS